MKMRTIWQIGYVTPAGNIHYGLFQILRPKTRYLRHWQANWFDPLCHFDTTFEQNQCDIVMMMDGIRGVTIVNDNLLDWNIDRSIRTNPILTITFFIQIPFTEPHRSTKINTELIQVREKNRRKIYHFDWNLQFDL